MCLLNALKLQIYPMEAMVKAGDTISDIGEGLNAGMWTVGFTRSGNELGLTQEESESLPPGDLEARISGICRRYREAGAHYVVEGIWELMPVIEDIEKRLSLGETP
jgi:phosphonoacetaldehyde hydrolase